LPITWFLATACGGCGLAIWLRGLAGFAIADLGFYWGHRWEHEIPLLWRFHKLHHAPEHIYFLVSSRAHPIDNAFVRLCGLTLMYITGLGAPQSVQGTLIATLIVLFFTVWGFFIHADVRWRFGPLEWLISTPGFHHWHHTHDEMRDHNYASMLPAGTGCSARCTCRSTNGRRVTGSKRNCRIRLRRNCCIRLRQSRRAPSPRLRRRRPRPPR